MQINIYMSSGVVKKAIYVDKPVVNPRVKCTRGSGKMYTRFPARPYLMRAGGVPQEGFKDNNYANNFFFKKRCCKRHYLLFFYFSYKPKKSKKAHRTRKRSEGTTLKRQRLSADGTVPFLWKLCSLID